MAGLHGESPERLVVGLGNPGPEYAATRHNVGFRVVEHLARRAGAVFVADPGLRGRLARARIAGRDCVLLEPLTFMNRSGESVGAALERWPALAPERDLLVVLDDLDLPPGRLRLRPSGGAGGHRGLADIARELATQATPRLRFGIGHPGSAAQVVDWVLEPFSEAEEAEVLPAAVERAADAVACVVGEGLKIAMDRFNAMA
ncbi:MAG: aminoacyl-tRNA hydrolase [Deltaproteobacteria bacterium]|nr:aminoacyl-tRNA hydrolase [Deltaproteobacteria bacterium]